MIDMTSDEPLKVIGWEPGKEKSIVPIYTKKAVHALDDIEQVPKNWTALEMTDKQRLRMEELLKKRDKRVHILIGD